MLDSIPDVLGATTQSPFLPFPISPDRIFRFRFPTIEPLVKPLHAQRPVGGLLTTAGALTAYLEFLPLGSILFRPSRNEPQSLLMNLEGGFIAVAPEKPLRSEHLLSRVRGLDLHFDGVLTSDQIFLIHLPMGDRVVFRRTILAPDQLRQALGEMVQQGVISKFEIVGTAGQGIGANFIVDNLRGKRRKFMSGLLVSPTPVVPNRPTLTAAIDIFNRLNFDFTTTFGFRQQFVEVPLEVPAEPKACNPNSSVSLDEVRAVALPPSPISRGEIVDTNFPVTPPVFASPLTTIPKGGFLTAASKTSSCRCVAANGSVMRKTSTVDPNIFDMTVEGGSIAVSAMRRLSSAQIASMMGSWNMHFSGPLSARHMTEMWAPQAPPTEQRIMFRKAIQSPEQLETALRRLVTAREAASFTVDAEEASFQLRGFARSRRRKFVAGLLVAPAEPTRVPRRPALAFGIDRLGRLTMESTSTLGYVQQFVEVPI